MFGLDAFPEIAASPGVVVMAAVFGAAWGSFLNVCIARIPRRMSIVKPPSHCFSCKTPVAAADNIPILSWLLLRGRCRHCGARFSARYAAVEALTALLSALLWWEFVAAPQPGAPVAVRLARFALCFVFAALLLVLSFIDYDTKELPDVLTLPSIPLFFAAGFGAALVPWHERLIGAFAGYVFLRLISDFYWHVLKREGMGLGDAKLLAVVGAVLGWKALPFALFIAALAGVAVSVPLLLWTRRHTPPTVAAATTPPNDSTGDAAAPPRSDAAGAEGDRDAPHLDPLRYAQIPFGPYLALGALFYLFFFDTFHRLIQEIVLR